MKTLIIYQSIHHQNTEKIAQIMASVLEADLLKTKDADAEFIEDYELIGFGSGIYYGKPHKKLLAFIDTLKNSHDKKAFIFTTSGKDKADYNQYLKDKVAVRGFDVIGEFSCKAFDTWGPLKLVGGINKGKPDENDLKEAEIFAKSLRK